MAEAAAAASPSAAAALPDLRFFCHRCTQEIHPKLPEYTCPHCETGFIEQLAEDQPSASSDDSTSPEADVGAQFAELWSQMMQDMERGVLLTPFLADTTNQPDHAAPTAPESVSGESLREAERDGPHRDRRFRPPRPRHSLRRHRSERSPAVEGIVQQVFRGLWNPVRPQFPAYVDILHSNPADYVWGAGGLDAIISQLIGQLDNTGPPPASHDAISALPTIKIDQQQVDNMLECTVCKEEYKLSEHATHLPCLHYFHVQCIVPWLKMHDSCPVCRKSLHIENEDVYMETE
uniref:E3 ubiquitin-protein ligase RNF115 isoform X2 n=1 Tax=Myxine glutinosa TaxID=7769 RepID=UPI00358E65B2